MTAGLMSLLLVLMSTLISCSVQVTVCPEADIVLPPIHDKEQLNRNAKPINKTTCPGKCSVVVLNAPTQFRVFFNCDKEAIDISEDYGKKGSDRRLDACYTYNSSHSAYHGQRCRYNDKKPILKDTTTEVAIKDLSFYDVFRILQMPIPKSPVVRASNKGFHCLAGEFRTQVDLLPDVAPVNVTLLGPGQNHGCFVRVNYSSSSGKIQFTYDARLASTCKSMPLQCPNFGKIAGELVCCCNYDYCNDITLKTAFESAMGTRPPVTPTTNGLAIKSSTLHCLNGSISTRADVLPDDAPVKSITQSQMDGLQPTLLLPLLDRYKCFVRVVVDKSSGVKQVHIKYGIQSTKLCPPSPQRCLRFTTVDGAVCCCDENDCNKDTPKAAFASANGAPTSVTSTTTMPTPTTNGSITTMTIGAIITGVLLVIMTIICILLAVILWRQKKQDNREKKTIAEKEKVATPPTKRPSARSVADENENPYVRFATERGAPEENDETMMSPTTGPSANTNLTAVPPGSEYVLGQST